jgi:hypothetical protein
VPSADDTWNTGSHKPGRFPWLVLLTDAPIIIHCKSSQISKCHTVWLLSSNAYQPHGPLSKTPAFWWLVWQWVSKLNHHIKATELFKIWANSHCSVTMYIRYGSTYEEEHKMTAKVWFISIAMPILSKWISKTASRQHHPLCIVTVWVSVSHNKIKMQWQNFASLQHAFQWTCDIWVTPQCTE